MIKNSFKKLLPSSIKYRYRMKLAHYYNGLSSLGSSYKVLLAKIKRQFVRPPFPDLNGRYNLHLGCGNINHSKFVNVDGLPASHIHYVRNIDDLSFLPDNKVDLIYACHCLEHFSHHIKVELVLSEWFRVLKKDGILRLSVPDFDLILNIYKDNDNSANSIVGILMGGQDYKYNFHMTIFNQSSLTEILLKVGFSQVREWTPGTDELSTFDDYSGRKLLVNGKYYPVSLNLEAIR
jgi:predicted SAM-dependent methyltransferase